MDSEGFKGLKEGLKGLEGVVLEENLKGWKGAATALSRLPCLVDCSVQPWQRQRTVSTVHGGEPAAQLKNKQLKAWQ